MLFRGSGWYYDVTIDEETADLIWHPKIDFLNVLTVENPTGFGYKNTHEFFAYDTNKILMAEPLKIKVSCNFNFLNFPFDFISINHTMNLGSFVCILKYFLQ